MNRTFLWSMLLLPAVLALPTVQSAQLKPIVEFPQASNVTSTVRVGEILRGRNVQRVDVLLDRAVEFGPVSLHGEMAEMLSLLASPQSVSEPRTSLLALEDQGPTIRVALSGRERPDHPQNSQWLLPVLLGRKDDVVPIWEVVQANGPENGRQSSGSGDKSSAIGGWCPPSLTCWQFLRDTRD